MTEPRALVIVFLLTAVIGGTVAMAERVQPTVALHVLDVGQGDAILLRSGSADVLVDGGPDATVLQRLGALRPAWDRRIEVVVLTHPQQDHLAGFLPLLEREQVGLLILPRIAAENDLFRAFVESVLARGIPVRFAEIGQRISADGLTLTVLGPDAQALALGKKNPNNGAIVLRAEFLSAFSALLTGDIERPAEHLLVRRWGAALDVDILKVAHHGSKTSTTVRLLRATSPSLAVVSSGAGNRFGHPHEVVLARLADLKVLRTDERGTVSLIARGGRMTLSCSKSCSPQARLPTDLP